MKSIFSDSRSLFSPGSEAINLILPFLFFIATGYALLVGYRPNGREVDMLVFVKNYIFLDSIHTLFTYLTLSLLPEGRAFVREAVKAKRRWIYLSPLFLMALFAFETSLSYSTLNPYFTKLVIGLIFGLSLQHVAGQMSGISSMYNRHALAQKKLSQAELSEFRALQQSEAKSFKLFAHLQWLAPLSLDPHLRLPLIFNVTYASVLIVLAVKILLNSSRMHQIAPSNKFLYQLRLIYWSGLSYRHEIGLIGMNALHGIEYFFISYRMMQNSRLCLLAHKIAGFFAVVIVGYSILRQGIWQLPAELLWVAVGLTAIQRSMDFTHYYIDSAIFKFKNRESRVWLAPLLEKRYPNKEVKDEPIDWPNNFSSAGFALPSQNQRVGNLR